MTKKRWNWLMAGGLLLLFSVFAGGCNSTSEELFPVSITIEEIEVKLEQAQDPDGRFATATSYVQRQISENLRFLEEENEGMLVEVKFLVPDKLKITNFVDNEPQSGTIIDGKEGWSVDYAQRRYVELNERQMQLIQILTQLGNPGKRLSQIFEKIQIQGCRIDDKEYYKLSCQIDEDDLGLPALEIYIDCDDFLIRRYHVHNIVSEMVRYGLREGVQIPIEVETRVGRQRTRGVVTDYKLNVEIPASEFGPPVF